jgi:hypothetical protein
MECKGIWLRDYRIMSAIGAKYLYYLNIYSYITSINIYIYDCSIRDESCKGLKWP